jgi:alpha-tubulin suppressor-like RCC1 family protein
MNVGTNHGCLVTSDGSAKCWGSGGSGRLGTGNTGDRSRPTDVSGLASGVVEVSAGALHGCARMGDGGVKCWGANAAYQLATGGGSTATQTTPVNVALDTAAAFLGSMRDDHACVITPTGGLRCWGDNTFGQLGAGNMSVYQSPTPVANITSGATWVSAGASHTCAVASTNVYCWGSGSAGQLGLGNGNTRTTPGQVPGVTASMVAAGSFHTCAVTMAGALKCWGQNSEYQLGDPSTTAGSASPLDVAGLTSGVAFACGGWRHTCVVTTAGGVKCFGRNAEGQLGIGFTSATSASPVDVSGLTSGAAKVFCGETHTCALLTNGSVKCWGANGGGKLGDGTTTPRLTPVFLSGTP